jgi:hypothetical protein
MTVVAPSGVVTFLFTDVEGSTRLWEADGDGMRAALAAHDDVLRSAIEAHDGFLFKHTGDGVVAAFASPRSAVDAAIAAQRELKLPVRMGLATGDAELRGSKSTSPARSAMTLSGSRCSGTCLVSAGAMAPPVIGKASRCPPRQNCVGFVTRLVGARNRISAWEQCSAEHLQQFLEFESSLH